MERKIDRRKFLKVMGAATLAVSGGSVVASAETMENSVKGEWTKLGSYEESYTAQYLANLGITYNNFYVTGYYTMGSFKGVFQMTKKEDVVRERRWLEMENFDITTGYDYLVMGDSVYQMGVKEKKYALCTDEATTAEEMQKLAEKIKRASKSYCFALPTAEYIKNVNVGEWVLNGKTYFAERFLVFTEEGVSPDGLTWFNGSYFVYCYDGDELKYVATNDSYYLEVKMLSADPDETLLEIPKGYHETSSFGSSIEKFSIESNSEKKSSLFGRFFTN